MLNTREVFTKMVVGMILMPMMFFYGCAQARQDVAVAPASPPPSKSAVVSQELATQQQQQAQPLKILFIGDSHTVGTFGKQFSKELTGIFRGQVTRYGITGSAVVHWMGASWPSTFVNECIKSEVGTDGKEVVLKSSYHPGECVPANFPHYDQLLQDNFDAVVIALGTNDIMNYCSQTPAQQATAMDKVRRMPEIAKQKAKTCIWVGPPPFRKVAANETKSVIEKGCRGDENLYKTAVDMLKAEVENSCCIYVDSRQFRVRSGIMPEASYHPDFIKDCLRGEDPMYPDRKSDNLHFDGRGTYWARCAALEVKDKLDKAKIEPLRKPDGTPCSSATGNPAQTGQ
jgi:hypothetical protein